MKHSQDYQNLIKAIELAYNRHSKIYGNKQGEPVCVIGQLGSMYGVHTDEWSEGRKVEDIDNWNQLNRLPFDCDFLMAIQERWDNSEFENKEVKEILINFVKDNYEDFH